MKKFEHGGAVYRAAHEWGVDIDEVLDFSANINPLVTVELLNRWTAPYMKQILHYPDVEYHELKEAICNYHQTNREQLVLGNGATELIHALIRYLKPKTARLTAPTFGEYEKALCSVGAEIELIGTASECLTVDLDRLFDDSEGVDVIFVCNPNNPTGKKICTDALKEKMSILHKNTTCIIDEAFIDFTIEGEKNSVVDMLSQCPNVIILRSATKFFGIPGLRLGYLMSDNQRLVESLTETMPVWHINVLAAGVVIEGLKDKDFHDRTRRYVDTERKFIEKGLEGLGIHYYKSCVNYLLIKSPIRHPLDQAMAPYKILVRSCENYNGIRENIYRIAVRTRMENERLLFALNRIMEETTC
ncbi:threonine-phosphate decarboxylase CobD [Fusibacter sp. A1]|uniref:threonine-phosphate decarboxylase CobD n=2 Tax=unclassified Fusibacter TaxID=2624464 RepID=UPI0013E90472|nr:threonine-phosphate decarboxylase CobD [Fusibacter sp. A1]MCK8059759.1 threonine-phosphate decarboxylase CobD [Fusibacter sp. A2]NPE21560.1 threonine-phosphate decarboxylase [Fusibacter sp. A1]